MKRLGKIIKYIVLSILALFIIANLIILLSGRIYIYKGLASTYFRGVPRPTIYDQTIFNNRKISHGNGEQWKLQENTHSTSLSETDSAFITSLNPASFLVLKGDEIIYEEYWGKHDVNATGNSFSMAKSIVSLLIGVALKEGDIQSLDEPVANYLPEFKGDKENITIRHILTMSSGLSWSENYYHPFCDVAELYYDTDARDLSLNRRTIEEPPGEIWRYKSGDTQVLMYILEAATGRNVTTYASEKLWRKIGAESDALWSLVGDKDSEVKAYCCFYATSRDFARLGKLINNNGYWNGQEVIDSSYLSSFKSLAPLKKANGKANLLYGFQYWIYKGLPFEVTYFRGMAGQYIISIPSKDLVIVRTGDGTLANWTNTANEKNDALEGHRMELPTYINIGLSILNQTN
ncbi:serine hydrolase [Putridiphycobacter roseus]|uniref:Serine hydrolase n=1 Tax=Putridiphycobacter roseus TaxID=2219161 RepID=A0A2W1NPN9_9FLAO|nr:serine hydrolase [Putridiphycobacter roseus]PZE16588.1 serine hydrolase [Putridiphycobacter roseus]